MPSVPLTHINVELTKGNQVIIFLTATWLIILGILGMAPLPTIPINDKALHFFGVRFISCARSEETNGQMGFATFLVYFIIEVPEYVLILNARRWK